MSLFRVFRGFAFTRALKSLVQPPFFSVFGISARKLAFSSKIVSVKNLPGGSSGNYGRIFLLSGVMTFLGLDTPEEEKEDELIMTLKRSVMLMQRGELAKAEQMLHLALKLAQERMSVDGITYTYDLMANLAMERGEFAKAERLFVTVMQRLMSAGMPETDNKIIHMSIKLATMFADQFFEGKDPKKSQDFLTKSENGYGFCKERLQKKIDAGDDDNETKLLLSLALEGEGRLFAGQDMLPKARLFYEKALELSERGGDTEERISSLLGYLGAISAMQNEAVVAQGYLERALRMARKNNLDSLPSILVNLGILKIHTGALSEARNNCKEAFNISHKSGDKDTENQAVHCLDEVNMAFKIKQ